MRVNQLYFALPHRVITGIVLFSLLLSIAYLVGFSTAGKTRQENKFETPEKISGTTKNSKELLLQKFDFDVVTTDSTGKIINRRKGEGRYFAESLDSKTSLDMVEIPGGSFLMGTSYSEASAMASEYKRRLNESTEHYGDEYVARQIPQHRVDVRPFYIGKFEVTQSQWRAVARLPKVSRDLSPDPSFFKGDNLPVEGVTWEDAVEFCERLSRTTGREYRLPSEAEWEYACRAGTSTQFHFGNTITPELVNSNGHAFGAVPDGINRERTIAVGSLGVANAFGLYDMHGNVEEWCMDVWHENYNSAPTDGRVWENHGGSIWKGCGIEYRVVRGGSWLLSPCFSRSANRSSRGWTKNNTHYTGFRVVAVVQPR